MVVKDFEAGPHNTVQRRVLVSLEEASLQRLALFQASTTGEATVSDVNSLPTVSEQLTLIAAQTESAQLQRARQQFEQSTGKSLALQESGTSLNNSDRIAIYQELNRLAGGLVLTTKFFNTIVVLTGTQNETGLNYSEEYGFREVFERSEVILFQGSLLEANRQRLREDMEQSSDFYDTPYMDFLQNMQTMESVNLRLQSQLGLEVECSSRNSGAAVERATLCREGAMMVEQAIAHPYFRTVLEDVPARFMIESQGTNSWNQRFGYFSVNPSTVDMNELRLWLIDYTVSQ